MPRPGFIEELSRAHYARLARCVVLHGNTNDLFPIGPLDSPRYGSLEAVLSDAFGHARYPRRGADVPFVVMTLKASGIVFASDTDRVAIAAIGTAAADRDPCMARDIATFLREVAKERAASIVTLTLVAELLRLISRARKLGIPMRPVAAHHRPRGDAPAGRRSGATGTRRPRGDHRLRRPLARRCHLGRGGDRRRLPGRGAAHRADGRRAQPHASPSCPRPRASKSRGRIEALRRSFVSARLAALGPGALGLSAPRATRSRPWSPTPRASRCATSTICSPPLSARLISSGSTVPRSWPSSTVRSRSVWARSITVDFPEHTMADVVRLQRPEAQARPSAAAISTIPSGRPRASPSSDPMAPARRSSSRRSPARPTGRSSRWARSAASGTARRTSSPRPSQRACRPSAASFAPGRRSACRLRLDALIGRRTRPRRDWLVT